MHLRMHSSSACTKKRSLGNEGNRRVYSLVHCPQIVVATNVAETSITIDDVTAVIDTGRVKQTGYDPARGIAGLQVPQWLLLSPCVQKASRLGLLHRSS